MPDSIEKSPFTTTIWRPAPFSLAHNCAPRSRSLLKGLASGPVTNPMYRCPTAERCVIARDAAAWLSTWALGTPRDGLYSQPFTMGANRPFFVNELNDLL